MTNAPQLSQLLDNTYSAETCGLIAQATRDLSRRSNFPHRWFYFLLCRIICEIKVEPTTTDADCYMPFEREIRKHAKLGISACHLNDSDKIVDAANGLADAFHDFRKISN